MARLFIGNIPHSSSEEDLKQWIESWGFQTESAEIVRNNSSGRSRGFGFVTLAEDRRLQEAIDVLHGQRMGGRALTVNVAIPRS